MGDQIKTREELKEMFKQGAKPSGLDFFDFIESVIVSQDDGIYAPREPETPIKIRAKGKEEHLFDFYPEEKKEGQPPTWRLYQKPQTVESSGLTLADSKESPRLFVQQDADKIGMGTKRPEASLDIKTKSPSIRLSADPDSLSAFEMRKQDGRFGFDIVHDGTKNTLTIKSHEKGEVKEELIVIESETGKIGIGTKNPAEKLEVSGTVKAETFVGDGSGLTGVTGIQDSELGKKIHITKDGKIGIGTKAPYTDVEVNGEIGAEKVSSRQIEAENISAGRFICQSSDLMSEIFELKKRIEQLEEKLK